MYKYFSINESTTLESVKRQYRRLSMQHHPDMKKGSAEKFREVNEEYKKVLEEIKHRAKNTGDQNLYKLINEQLIDVDSLINKLNVPEQFKPAIAYLAELGVNKLGETIHNKLNSQTSKSSEHHT